MKTINFSVKEILPSLLDKNKTQTIRSAWEELNCERASINSESLKPILMPKSARFKVGDKIKLFWNQRSKYRYFCRKCGNGVAPSKNIHMSHSILESGFPMSCKKCKWCSQEFFPSESFNKHLGTGIVTEVFKIEMCYNDTESWIDSGFPEKVTKGDLAKRDGFSSSEQMFSVLDKMYDLSQAKQFYVYRWRWQSHKDDTL